MCVIYFVLFKRDKIDLRGIEFTRLNSITPEVSQGCIL